MSAGEAEVGGRGAVRWSVESPTASRIEDSKLGQGKLQGLAGIWGLNGRNISAVYSAKR